MIGGGDPFYLKFWVKVTALERNLTSLLLARRCYYRLPFFGIIFVCYFVFYLILILSFLFSCELISIRKFFESFIYTFYFILFLHFVWNTWNALLTISERRYCYRNLFHCWIWLSGFTTIAIGCQLLLITNMKSHTGFRFVSIPMILNGVIALILRFSLNSIALLADYVTVVEDRPIISVKYCLPVPVFHFWPKLMYPAAWSLCDSWAPCINL